MNTDEQQQDGANLILAELLSSCRSVQLASQGKRGPEASYTPFLYEDGDFYILISELAGHTENLIAHPTVGVMLIEDEEKSRNLFARTRLTLQCRAVKVKAETEEQSRLLDLYQQRHGDTVALLRTLPDFHLFRLSPDTGRFVIGFGRAFRVALPGFELQPITADKL